MDNSVTYISEFKEYVESCKNKDFRRLMELAIRNKDYFQRCQRFFIEHGEAKEWMYYVEIFRNDPRIDKMIVTDQLLAWRGKDYNAMCNAYLWLSEIIDMDRWTSHCTKMKEVWCN